MYKIFAGVLSVIIFAPLVFFSNGEVSAQNIVDASAVEVIDDPALIISQRDFENLVEQDVERPSLENQPALETQSLAAHQEAALVADLPKAQKIDLLTQATDFYSDLQVFVHEAHTGQADVITGIFVNEDFSLDVVQQPANNPGFISEQEDVVTDFALSRDYGTIGMLAHNYLAGKQFDEFVVGQVLYLVYGDKQFTSYTIVSIESFQALSPHSPYSDFVRLDESGERISATDLFYRVYGQEDALVLQTCIEKDGNLSWGRLFITAEPTNLPVNLAMLTAYD